MLLDVIEPASNYVYSMSWAATFAAVYWRCCNLGCRVVFQNALLLVNSTQSFKCIRCQKLNVGRNSRVILLVLVSDHLKARIRSNRSLFQSMTHSRLKRRLFPHLMRTYDGLAVNPAAELRSATHYLLQSASFSHNLASDLLSDRHVCNRWSPQCIV